jgi:hypothetical protein
LAARIVFVTSLRSVIIENSMDWWKSALPFSRVRSFVRPTFVAYDR